MINAFAMAKKIGLSTNSFNLIGAPFETEETIWDTINLNREIKPDQIQISILMPLKGTKVRALFEKKVGCPMTKKWVILTLRFCKDYQQYQGIDYFHTQPFLKPMSN